MGWEVKRRKGQSQSKKKKKRRTTYPAGERDKDYQQLPSSRARAEPVRQRGQSTEAAKSQAQGGGAPPAALTQPQQATPSTTSSAKSSKAARPSGSCLGTWTMSQPKPPLAEPGLGKESSGDEPAASRGPGPRSQEIRAAQDTTPGARWEERGRRGPGRRETKRERGGFRSTSFSLPLPLAGSGCPTLPKVLRWVTAGRG